MPNRLKLRITNYELRIVCALIFSLVISSDIVFANPEVLAPPIINFYNKQVSNNEIFYISGAAEIPGADVIIYFQREDGGLFSQTVKSDEFGRWSYYHPQFLNKGSYIIWTQLKADSLSSPPSPQIRVSVESTALQVGSVRIGYDALSFTLALIMFLFGCGLVLFILYHYRFHTVKKKVLDKEIAKAEAMVHYGFQSLKKDILIELELIRKKSGGLSPEIQEKESEILKDIETIDVYLQEEFSELERLGMK